MYRHKYFDEQNKRLIPIYPEQPVKYKACGVNVAYDTLPQDHIYTQTFLGPASVKKLQSPDPNRLIYPKNTLYDIDTSTYYQNGVMRSYGSKLYPLTHKSPHEIREYTGMLPLPNLFEWTEYKVVTE